MTARLVRVAAVQADGEAKTTTAAAAAGVAAAADAASARPARWQAADASRRATRVLALGPAGGLRTGQSEAFRAYVANSSLSVQVIDNGSEGRPLPVKLGVVGRMMAQVAAALILNRPHCLYITTSRSRLGALKDLPVLLAARLAGVTVVNHLHGGDFLALRSRLSGPERMCLDLAYRSVAVSIVLAERMKEQYAAYRQRMEIEVVSNPVDSSCLFFGKQHEPVDGRPIRILYLSNLVRAKGVMDLIEAVRRAEAARRGCRLELRVAGAFSDPSLAEAEVRAALSGTAAGRYCGVARGGARAGLLRWADVIALPTYCTEGVPLALLEGMAAGCLVLTTRAGYIADAIGPEAEAVFVEARRPDRIAQALLALDSDRAPLRRAAQRNARLAAERFPLSRYVERIDEIVERAAHAGSCAVVRSR